jgi:hypothetical protein
MNPVHIFKAYHLLAYADVTFIWDFPTKISAYIYSFRSTARLINNPTILDEKPAYEKG